MSSWKQSFNFNKGQRRAIVLLLLIIAVIIFFRIRLSTRTAEYTDYDRMAIRIDSFLQAGLEQEQSSRKKSRYTSNETKSSVQIKLRPFDPNTASFKVLQELGFSKQQANTVLKYVQSGGSFTYKEDLKKIYVISENDYRKWENYILLPERNDEDGPQEDEPFSYEESETLLSIELNAANQEQLIEVRGIGPVLSRNIIKYRSLLGGYSSVDQLQEVYGIDAETFDRINQNFLVNSDSIQKKNINKLSFNELQKHPYISRKMAFEISNHVKYKGKFQSWEELLTLQSINDSLIAKIYPYFVVQ